MESPGIPGRFKLAKKVIYLGLVAVPVIGLLVAASLLHTTLGYILQAIGTILLATLAYFMYRWNREVKGRPPEAR